MTDERQAASHGTLRRIVRSYGLLIIIAIGFLLLALMVREPDRTVIDSQPYSVVEAV